MNRHATTPDVEMRLRQTWRRQRRVTHGRGLGILLASAAALFLLLLTLDRLLLPGRDGRMFLLALSAVTLAVIAYRCWWKPLARYDPVRLALRVERAHPYLRSLLVSYVQLRAGEGDALVQAMRQQARQAAAPLDFAAIVDPKPMRRALRLALLCLLGLGALTTLRTQDVKRFLTRMVSPDATVGYPARTRIVNVDYPRTVRAGESATVTAHADGLVPNRAELLVHTRGDSSERLPMSRQPGEGDAVFTHQFSALWDSIDFHVRVGDARSETFRVAVVPPPRLTDGRVALVYPAYTGMAATGSNDMNFSAVRGATAQWTLRFDRALASARFSADPGGTVEMELDADGLTARATRTLDESFAYHLRLTDRAHRFSYEPGLNYFVRVDPDAPPTVTLLEPAEDALATPMRRIDLACEVGDDFGVMRMWIVYWLNDEPEKRIEWGPVSGRRVDARRSWRPADDMKIAEGDVLVLALEAEDNRPGPDGPNRGRSAVRRFTFVSPAEYLRLALEETRRQLRLLEEARREERAALEQLRRLGPTMEGP